MNEDRRHLIATTQSPRQGLQTLEHNAHQRQLGAAAGMQRMTIIEGRLEQGEEPARLCLDPTDEAFLLVRSGAGLLECDDQRLALTAGDLLSIRTPDSPPEITNPGNETLVWLIGVAHSGNRATR